MRTLRAAAVAAALACTPLAHADEISYTYLDVGYAAGENDDLDESGSGWAARFSGQLTEHLFLEGTYGKLEYDLDVLGVSVDAEEDRWEVGLGVPYQLRDGLHVFGVLGYAKVTAEASVAGFSASLDEGALMAAAGVRWLPMNQLEFTGRVVHRAYDDSDTAAVVGVRYYISDTAAIIADGEFGSNAKLGIIGLRIDFGRDPY
jgi:hypothetical protein